MANKQTAVEWLIEQILYDDGYGAIMNSFDEMTDLSEFIEQAKEMEKEQIKEAVESGENNIDSGGYYIDKDYSKQYYNETYGK
jgi:hypothetical protein